MKFWECEDKTIQTVLFISIGIGEPSETVIIDKNEVLANNPANRNQYVDTALEV
jgi:hypothetical protein